MSEGGTAQTAPDAWVGQEAHLRYADADAPRWLDCTITEVNGRGVSVEAEGRTTFFPWGSVVRIDLGHARGSRSR